MQFLRVLSLISFASLSTAFAPSQRPAFGVCQAQTSRFQSAVVDDVATTEDSTKTQNTSIRNIAVIAHVRAYIVLVSFLDLLSHYHSHYLTG